MTKGLKHSKSIISLSVLGAHTPKALLFVVLYHLFEDPEGLFVVGTSKSRLHRAAIVDDYETIPFDSLGVKGKPILEVISSPNSADSFSHKFNILDFIKRDSFGDAEREVV